EARGTQPHWGRCLRERRGRDDGRRAGVGSRGPRRDRVERPESRDPVDNGDVRRGRSRRRGPRHYPGCAARAGGGANGLPAMHHAGGEHRTGGSPEKLALRRPRRLALHGRRGKLRTRWRPDSWRGAGSRARLKRPRRTICGRRLPGPATTDTCSQRPRLQPRPPRDCRLLPVVVSDCLRWYGVPSERRAPCRFSVFHSEAGVPVGGCPMAWFALARVLFVAAVAYAAAILQPLPVGLVANVAFALALAGLVVAIEARLRETAITRILGALIGCAIGLGIAHLI